MFEERSGGKGESYAGALLRNASQMGDPARSAVYICSRGADCGESKFRLKTIIFS